MIYHAFTLGPNGTPSPVWWAIHAETLTPVLIDITRLPIAALEIIRQPDAQTPFRSHPDANPDPTAIADEVFASLRQQVNPAIRNGPVRIITTADAPPPEYLLAVNDSGGSPAIIRTQDPLMILPGPKHQELLLGTPTHWKTSTDLPVTGWEYWWEDCQRAWDKLAPEFCAAFSE